MRATIATRARATSLGTMVLLCGVGCSAAPSVGAESDESALPSGWVERDPGKASTIPTYEQLRTTALRTIRDGDVFIVEGDMLFERDEALRAYYNSIYVNPSQKSIVNTVGGVKDTRSSPTSIKYCFAAGWGQPQGTYTAPPLEPLRTNLQQAMGSWEGVANVRFVYMSNLDGAACSTSLPNPGVSFVIQHYDDVGAGTPGTAFGPFPSNAWANQQLLVPASGLPRLLAVHELGHSLGFRHEHIAPDASPRCAESSNFIQLTPYDPLSCMRYANCTTGNSIAGNEVSNLDGVGARSLYDPPLWWWGFFSQP